MSTEQTRAVNCTQCGAPLDLNGGHRVRSLNCGYCGAVLDTRDEYKVVKQFKDVQRPPMPLPLGATGRVKGVDFTIIGVVQYADEEYERWLEYQIFSPSHGYHWLEYADGHFVFSRRVRERPRKAGVGTKFKVGENTYKFFGSYQARVMFVEGELTYVASVGDTVNIMEGVSPPYIFATETTGTEEEYQLGEYVPHAEVVAAFKPESPPPAPTSIHGAQPYEPNPGALALSKVGRWFAGAAALIAVALLFLGNGTEVLRESIPATQFVKGARTSTFTVGSSNTMMAVDVFSDLNNAWAWFDIKAIKGESSVARVSTQIARARGGDDDRRASAHFRIADPGTYHLAVLGTGGIGNSHGKPQDRPLEITVREGVRTSRWFFVLAVVALIAMIWEPLSRLRFESKRWASYYEE